MNTSTDPTTRATVEALEKFKESGRKVILVTGREIPDLLSVFSETAIFDLIVAENGALLYWPLTKEEFPLAEGPPKEFAELLRERAVNILSVGRVVVATMDAYEQVVHESIRELQLDLQVILNKDAVMVLPTGVDKATGLEIALEEIGVSPRDTVGVGDAENDQAFLNRCGRAVAVANALESVRDQADLVTDGARGAGVAELIDWLIATDLRDF